jgi:hypothetical protein
MKRAMTNEPKPRGRHARRRSSATVALAALAVLSRAAATKTPTA